MKGRFLFFTVCPLSSFLTKLIFDICFDYHMHEQTAGVGTTVEGYVGILQFQAGSLLSGSQNEPQQLPAFHQSGYLYGSFCLNFYDSGYYSLGTPQPWTFDIN